MEREAILQQHSSLLLETLFLIRHHLCVSLAAPQRKAPMQPSPLSLWEWPETQQKVLASWPLVEAIWTLTHLFGRVSIAWFTNVSAAQNVLVWGWSLAFTFWDVNYATRSFLCPFLSSVTNFRWQKCVSRYFFFFFSGMNRCKSVFNSLIKVTLGQIWYYTKSHITFKNEFFQP